MIGRTWRVLVTAVLALWTVIMFGAAIKQLVDMDGFYTPSVWWAICLVIAGIVPWAVRRGR